jgi:DNA polymerase
MDALKHVVAPPFAYTRGPHDAKIAFVGEAFGAEEDRVGQPFVGAAGRLLAKLCASASIDIEECFLTNVIAARPYELRGALRIKSNVFAKLCMGAKPIEETYSLTRIGQHGYLRPEFVGEIERLHDELATVRPNVIVALGAIALWGLTGFVDIGKRRGALGSTSIAGRNVKLLPTYHPAYLLRGGWADAPTVISDLIKAKRTSGSEQFERPTRHILINPTIDECREFARTAVNTSTPIACDIETHGGCISHVGFAVDTLHAFVFPFVGTHEGSYWERAEDECIAWECIAKILASGVSKVYHNGMFDIAWFVEHMGLRVMNANEDTMLLQHALEPEMLKGLGYLGSIYTDEPAWKLMRTRARDTLKRDE